MLSHRICCAIVLSLASLASAEGGFELKDQAGSHLDVLLDGKTVARYMYAYDKSSPEKLALTYKPYLHVFDADGKNPITKGPGGQYTHHRGIFIGWNQIKANGKTYDRWHMKGGEQIHQKFADQKTGPDQASFTSVVHWNDEAGQPLIEEQRTFTFRRPPAGAHVIIDFSTVLKPTTDLTLGGDPEHAGVHFRPANEVAAKETVYVFPKENADPKKDLDYPWVGETFTLAAKRYSVVQMSHPENPQGTKWSAYRDYGRFGAFFTTQLKKDQALKIQYRFLVAAGEMPAAELIQKNWDEYAGVKQPSPTPKTTAIGSAPRGKGK